MKLRFFAVLFINTILLSAQSTEPEMADTFRAEGKIYVVVSVCLIVLFGLIAYLTGLDRRLRRLEETNKKFR